MALTLLNMFNADGLATHGFESSKSGNHSGGRFQPATPVSVMLKLLKFGTMVVNYLQHIPIKWS